MLLKSTFCDWLSVKQYGSWQVAHFTMCAPLVFMLACVPAWLVKPCNECCLPGSVEDQERQTREDTTTKIVICFLEGSHALKHVLAPQEVQKSALEAMTDLLLQQLAELGKTSHDHANLAGRTDRNINDVVRHLSAAEPKSRFSISLLLCQST